MELNELPGSELILPGLEDLHQGKSNTIGSLLNGSYPLEGVLPRASTLTPSEFQPIKPHLTVAM
jgi:hypothetical protein